MLEGCMFAPSIAQPNPNDNHDTMCADWQGTRLAVNSCTNLTVITEAGAAAQTPFPYSILRSEIRLQNQFWVFFDVRRAFLVKFWASREQVLVDIATSEFLKANAPNSVEPLL